MKCYNGVAVLSRIPFAVAADAPYWCGKGDCRHLAVRLDLPGGPAELHNFYVPAGGDIPDPASNAKIAHKLDFVAEATRAPGSVVLAAMEGSRPLLVEVAEPGAQQAQDLAGGQCRDHRQRGHEGGVLVLRLLDELAHDNLNGGVHAKRWQDALALREQGISVIGAFNICLLYTSDAADE